MKFFTKTRLWTLAGAAVVAVPLISWITYPGSPRWPFSGGFHYVVDLHPVSFPAGHPADDNAQWSMSDWRDIGATSFTPGVRRSASNAADHSNGRSTWIWTDRPGDTWLGVTYVRWSGGTMQDCDIWYNSRSDYSWSYSIFDPTVYRWYWPINFRSVARHECGHAIGLSHEDRTLDNMNHTYQHGNGVQHVQTTGMMPHADDKAGGRWLYPRFVTARNVMATNWREPAPGSGSARQETQETGSWAAGSTRDLEFWLSNQSNATVPGGSDAAVGIRVGAYLSTNRTISSFDHRVGEWWFTGNWDPYGSGRFVLNTRVPSNFPAGTYYVGVLFDNRDVVSEQWSSDNAAPLGRVNVTNTLRTLRVRSVNASSMNVTVSPTDSAGRGDGRTPFDRTYWNSERVTLTAPLVVLNPFRYWRINGLVATTSRTVGVTMDRTRTAEAVYWRRVRGSVRNFGQPGCRGSNGRVPSHTVTGHINELGPQQGDDLRYNVSNAASGVPAVVFLGLRTDFWGRYQLPLLLDPLLGTRGCYLNHDILHSLSTRTSGLGFATIHITYPTLSAAVGTRVYSTYGALDRGANPAGLVMSNSINLLLGGLVP